MKVEIHLYSQSLPVIVDGALNAYTKDDLYCVLTPGFVVKFPLVHIFRIKEFTA